jgi:hypothetical protein
LDRRDLDHGREKLRTLLERAKPKLVIFTFKMAAQLVLGKFPGDGFVPVPEWASFRAFVMPGPYQSSSLVKKRLAELEREFKSVTTGHPVGRV